MCGVCGILRFNKEVSPHEIEAMKSVLVHRGPDDEGTFFCSAKVSGRTIYIGLGHRRLSIIDLSANARQPMSNEDGRIWLTYNGEIYNFAELRDELICHGHEFRTRSDTEVIIHAYEQWGTSCLDKFNGMFAFGLWDAGKKEMFLARDRVGIKPLYYYYDSNTFVFGSELKAILQIKGMPREVNYQSISDYLSWQFVPAPKIIFRGIKKLLPGHYLILREDGLTCKQYWSVRDFSGRLQNPDAKQYEEQIRAVLTDSVKKRMISDVPFGAFLSGGLDSSTVVALMNDGSGGGAKTFCIGFDSQEYASELEHARIVSKMYATEHHEKTLNTEKLLDLLPKLIWFMDEPFADHSMVPTYLVSEFARQNITVALSGDGGDENFGGYTRRYLFAKRYSRYLQQGEFIRSGFECILMKALRPVLACLPDNNVRKKMYKLTDMLKSTGLMRIVNLNNVVDVSLKKKVLDADIQRQVNLHSTVGFSKDLRSKGTDLLEEVLMLDIENYLVNDILTKVDRMSMANSLEVRVPLLDHRLVELAASIPAAVKVQGNTTKYIMKNAFRDCLPQSVIDRRKQGFGVPLKFWMRKKLTEFTSEILLDPCVKRRGILNHKTIEQMLKATSAKRCNYARELWTILVLELWCRRFLD